MLSRLGDFLYAHRRAVLYVAPGSKTRQKIGHSVGGTGSGIRLRPERFTFIPSSI